ncbi:hypothetical protein CPAR01_00960 [Colletotrichum paranaense]|uniref:Uncharacterized protein n=1 Tax=Colletotrichum paranaense TaxID=1914294 RepID=A0ABQ9T5D9_9PEZI|nr:uncharacterized protein CPAR01_00960 [Colletotrichum paranaense]KAK1546993.1 hypothetical protein CPAR01_00960 [Colletotrichum paranaense]
MYHGSQEHILISIRRTLPGITFQFQDLRNPFPLEYSPYQPLQPPSSLKHQESSCLLSWLLDISFGTGCPCISTGTYAVRSDLAHGDDGPVPEESTWLDSAALVFLFSRNNMTVSAAIASASGVPMPTPIPAAAPVEIPLLLLDSAAVAEHVAAAPVLCPATAAVAVTVVVARSPRTPPKQEKNLFPVFLPRSKFLTSAGNLLLVAVLRTPAPRPILIRTRAAVEAQLRLREAEAVAHAIMILEAARRDLGTAGDGTGYRLRRLDAVGPVTPLARHRRDQRHRCEEKPPW